MNYQTLQVEALGTHWFIDLPASKSNELITDLLTSTIKKFEEDYSRFRSESLIGKLNSQGVLANPPQELVNLLNFGLKLYDISGGVLDMSIGGVLESNGYGLSPGAKKSTNLNQDLVVEDSEIILHNNIHIDLGAFGKGWLIDKLAIILNENHIDDYVINGGGDILVGSRSASVFIQNPFEQSEHIGSIDLKNQSLAGSSNLLRAWTKAEQDYHHVPGANSKILSVHVQASSAKWADALATYCLIADHKSRLAIASSQDMSFLEVRTDGTLYHLPDFNFKSNAT